MTWQVQKMAGGWEQPWQETSIQCHQERFGKLFDCEHKGLILMLNRTGSEVSMINSSNCFLSPGGLVCPLDLQTLEKAGL